MKVKLIPVMLIFGLVFSCQRPMETEKVAESKVDQNRGKTKASKSANLIQKEGSPNANVHPSQIIKVAAFNADLLDTTKLEKSDVSDALVKIIKRYDVILFQEVRDVSGEAADDLMNLVNSTGAAYRYVINDRVGRAPAYKEQYAFFFNSARLSVARTYQYQDADDVFEWEPFSVVFREGDFEFGLMGMHIRATDAKRELNKVDAVAKEVQSELAVERFVVMGDFNADCGNISEDEIAQLGISGSSYKWLIGNNVNSMVATGVDCAFDRIVATNDVVSNGTKVYNFKTDLGLTQEKAEEVSSHFPVEFDLVMP